MKELYSIRFAHVRTDKDILCTSYTIDIPFLVGMRAITPKKITLAKDKRITVEFDDNSSHVLWYNEDCELFYREKDNGKVQDKVKSRRVRRVKDSK
jgi:protease II